VYSGSHLVINDFFRRNGGAQQVLQSKNVLELNKLVLTSQDLLFD